MCHGSDWVVGVIGVLQFEVLADRINSEYNIPVRFEQTELFAARWLESESATDLKAFINENIMSMANDYDGSPVFLARNSWHLNKMEEDWPHISFQNIKEYSY